MIAKGAGGPRTAADKALAARLAGNRPPTQPGPPASSRPKRAASAAVAPGGPLWRAQAQEAQEAARVPRKLKFKLVVRRPAAAPAPAPAPAPAMRTTEVAVPAPTPDPAPTTEEAPEVLVQVKEEHSPRATGVVQDNGAGGSAGGSAGGIKEEPRAPAAALATAPPAARARPGQRKATVAGAGRKRSASTLAPEGAAAEDAAGPSSPAGKKARRSQVGTVGRWVVLHVYRPPVYPPHPPTHPTLPRPTVRACWRCSRAAHGRQEEARQGEGAPHAGGAGAAGGQEGGAPAEGPGRPLEGALGG